MSQPLRCFDCVSDGRGGYIRRNAEKSFHDFNVTDPLVAARAASARMDTERIARQLSPAPMDLIRIFEINQVDSKTPPTYVSVYRDYDRGYIAELIPRPSGS